MSWSSWLIVYYMMPPVLYCPKCQDIFWGLFRGLLLHATFCGRGVEKRQDGQLRRQQRHATLKVCDGFDPNYYVIGRICDEFNQFWPFRSCWNMCTFFRSGSPNYPNWQTTVAMKIPSIGPAMPQNQKKTYGKNLSSGEIYGKGKVWRRRRPWERGGQIGSWKESSGMKKPGLIQITHIEQPTRTTRTKFSQKKKPNERNPI